MLRGVLRSDLSAPIVACSNDDQTVEYCESDSGLLLTPTVFELPLSAQAQQQTCLVD